MINKVLRKVMFPLFEEWMTLRSGSELRDSDRYMMGELMLEAKRNLWDSDCAFTPDRWDEYGFQVFSQSNEDGIIQYLIQHIDFPNRTFVEFGAGDYTECNTRFLLLHNDWSGFIMDGSQDNMQRVKQSSLYWKHNIEAIAAFITKENINELIRRSGFDAELGILSIDLDGNDYWIWEAINCVNPRIVICEYNPIYGNEASITVPYKEDFDRTDMHYSNLYWGASLGAFAFLARKKGYRLVCVNKMGHNAFFVRNDIADEKLKEVSVKEAFKRMQYRESRNENGQLTFLSPEKGLTLIQNEKVVDVTTGELKKLCDVYK